MSSSIKKNNTQENQPSYYAIIPASVRYCKDLEPNAKLLYGEITALCSKEGYCWASNQYLADLYDVKIRVVQNWLESLEKNGFISVVIDRKEFNAQRRIYLSDSFQNNFTACKYMHTGMQKNAGGHAENDTHSNTSSNTGNTTSPVTTTTGEKVDEQKPKERVVVVSGEMSSQHLKIFKTNGEEVIVNQSDIFRYFLNYPQYETPVIQEAIERVRKDPSDINSPLAYLKGICNAILKEREPYNKKEDKKETDQDITCEDNRPYNIVDGKKVYYTKTTTRSNWSIG